MPRKRRRQTVELVVWRKLVYRRDDWRCQWPGCGLGPRTKPFRHIEAHHIFKWANYPKLRHRVNNGITLCHEHHERVTDVEERYVVFFQKILKGAKKTWTHGKEARAKRDMTSRYLKSVRTVVRRHRKRRSRTAR